MALVTEFVKTDPKIGRGRVDDELNIPESKARKLLHQVPHHWPLTTWWRPVNAQPVTRRTSNEIAPAR